MRTSRFAMIVTIALLGQTATAAMCDKFCSDWPQRNAAPGTLANGLEEIFLVFSDSCGIIPKNSGQASRVPRHIQSEADVIGLSRAVLTIPNDSATRLMSFLFDQKNFSQINTAKRIDAANFIGQLAGNLPAPRIQSTIGGYKHTCTSYVRAALKAGLSVPEASANAALEREEDSTAYLILVRGTFQSPLYEAVTRADLASHLLFWSAYAAKGSYLPTYSYLKGYEGVAAIRTRTTDRRTKFDLAAGSTLGVGVLGASLSTATGLADGSNLQVDDYKNFIFLPKGSVSDLFAPAPKPSDIARIFKDATSSAISPRKRLGLNTNRSDAVIFDGERFSYWYDVDGIPEVLCKREAWSGSVNETGKPEVLTDIQIDVVTQKDKAADTCRFYVEGILANPAVQNTRINIAAKFRSSSRLRDSTTSGDESLQLDAQLPVRVSTHPQYLRPSNAIPFEETRDANGRRVSLQWRVPLAFDENERPWDRSKAQQIKMLTASKISCSRTGVTMDVALLRVEQASLVMQLDSAATHGEDEECDIALSVQLPLVSNVVVTRTINPKLFVPKI